MIRRAGKEDLEILAQFAVQVWENNSVEDLAEEFSKMIENKDSVCFLAYEDEKAVGFAQCQMRYDYVEGTEGSPVGYLEGIFVREECRHKGYAKMLLEACEKWTLSKGIKEFASDCELDNDVSLKFHLNVGFEEANRIICFTKKL